MSSAQRRAAPVGTTEREAKVRGRAVVGATLTCTAPKDMRGRLTYRWLQGNKPIRGATGAKLKLRRALGGRRVGCQIRTKVAGKVVTVRSSLQRVRR
jgi:hypothetical protein